MLELTPNYLWCLQAKFPGTLNITVDKLEGKTLRQQAALYYNASIVIQTHGAALGALVFVFTDGAASSQPSNCAA